MTDPATTSEANVEHVVGVGPWEGPWPEGEHWDRELLENGDRRNVADGYRYWAMDAIIADLDTRRHEFHVAVENWEHDFNIGSVIGADRDDRPTQEMRSGAREVGSDGVEVTYESFCGQCYLTESGGRLG